MYHNVNSELYSGLWNNINFIIKCSYLLFVFDILRKKSSDSIYLPKELCRIILHFMVQIYQKNDIKKINTKNIADIIFRLCFNLD